jgi:predicted PhzF superfamily epimerase YddE/YHI9
MKIPLYVIDAFTRQVFGGNPAAVCPLEDWLGDAEMQSIARENNLSETAFFVRHGDRYELRWFTPTVEVDLCGHATLASGYVVFNYLERERDAVSFETRRSGTLTVSREGEQLALDFPARRAAPCRAPAELIAGLGARPRDVLLARDYLAVYATEAEVRGLQPDFRLLAKLDCLGIIVTAEGRGETDFVSRFFAPGAGIDEDPVTGSAHCTLIPYWAEKLGKQKLHALQVSERGGELFCEDRGERVRMAGHAVRYSEGFLYL